MRGVRSPNWGIRRGGVEENRARPPPELPNPLLGSRDPRGKLEGRSVGWEAQVGTEGGCAVPGWTPDVQGGCFRLVTGRPRPGWAREPCGLSRFL